MTQAPMGRQNGSAMRAFREKEKLTVAAAARMFGLRSAQALRNVENGRTTASREVIRNAARVLGVPVEAITRDGTAAGIADEAPAEPEGAAA